MDWMELSGEEGAENPEGCLVTVRAQSVQDTRNQEDTRMARRETNA